VLKKAKNCLKGIINSEKRGACQESYIIVQDQICGDGEIVEQKKG